MRVVIAIVLCLFLEVRSEDGVHSETKTLTPEESSKAISAESGERETVMAELVARGVPPDNGGNYGDLIYR